MKNINITYFVHGTTTDNEKDLATGWEQGNLSKKGINQCTDLNKLIKYDDFDIVFCSDLKRATQSAKLIFGNKYNIVKDIRLRECNYGDLTGQPSNTFKDKLYNFVETPFPNGESYNDVEKRIADFLNYIKTNFPNKNIAIVAHQAPQLALDVLIKGKNWKQAIDEDWRKTKTWQPGWKYNIKF
jgi:broad specificity phosphatase PhoE